MITRRVFLGAVGAAALSAAYPRTHAATHIAFDTAQSPKSFMDDWSMQSSDEATASGDKLSQPGAEIDNWYKVTLPTTVMAALLAAGEYPDISHGENLKQVPKERFKNSWWYRKEFTLPPNSTGKQFWLYFKGINYRANIWLNGKLLADSNTAVGAYRDFELNITAAISADSTNALAVEVFPPDKGDLSITFVDWAPTPPDLNMGIWQDVELRTSGPVAIRHPHILTDLDVPSLTSAALTVMADCINATDNPVIAMLTGKIEKIEFSQQVTLAPRETKTITFTAEDFPQLKIDHPRIWWPYQLGDPQMYDLNLTATVGGDESHHRKTSFGIRKVTSRLDNGHRLFTVNGIDTLILGGGYAPDLFQRRILPDRPTWQEDHIRYVKDMNLNTIRLEGKLEDDAFFDICDRNGILVMAGWCCCSPWEQWKNWKAEQHTVAEESLRYQIRKLRTHPCMLVWLNGSDNHPPQAVEKEYLQIEDELHWPNPTLSSATAAKSAAAEPTGVKMEGPYKWEPPIYWMTDKKKGGAWGFNTEVGPGAVPPPLESLEQMLPLDHRWPIDEVWNYHCGANTFANFNDFLEPLNIRFGQSKGIADFSWKAQAQAYETIRAMYEGFRRNKFNATGEIQWMLNNACPSMIWHLYDYYFRPGAAYFATKLGCEPLHILYSYDNASIAISNDSMQPRPNLTASAEIYDADSKLQHKQSAPCSVPANGVTTAFTLPDLPGISTTYFLRLTLTNSAGEPVSLNSYFLSTKPDVLSTATDDKDDWNITRCSSFADYTQLEKLPPAKLELSELTTETIGADSRSRLTVTNSSQTIAVLVRLKLTKGQGGAEILPIRWQDNYFMLLPGEKREITATFLSSDIATVGNIGVDVDCFNNGRT
jgi:exo-1,4-beta-D-glucosaminidase